MAYRDFSGSSLLDGVNLPLHKLDDVADDRLKDLLDVLSFHGVKADLNPLFGVVGNARNADVVFFKGRGVVSEYELDTLLPRPHHLAP